MSADLGFTSVFSFSFFFFRPLICELAKRNSTKIGHMVRSKCDLKTHVRNLGYPLLYKSGTRNHPFLTISQLSTPMISIPTVGLLPSFCPNYCGFTAAPITMQLFITGHVTRFEQIPSRVYIDL